MWHKVRYIIGCMVLLFCSKLQAQDKPDYFPLQHLIRFNGLTCKWNNWADVLTPSDAEELATYDDQFYKGKAAVLFKCMGKGSVTYIGADTDDGKLERDVLQHVYKQAGITIEVLPAGLAVEWRDGFWVALNYASTSVTVPIPASATIITGGRQLPPAGVAVWMDKN
jgi:beta-galactosidase